MKPTTIEGVVAVLEYAMQPEFEVRDPETALDWDNTIFSGSVASVDPIGGAAHGFLLTIAEALREMSEKASS